jgi:hypothetical protein
MRSKASLLLVIALLALLALGCAKSIYHFNAYDRKLESYLMRPERLDAYGGSLNRIIDKSKAGGKRVPPGIYAEYGRVLYDKQQYGRAIEYFELEKSTYGESATLMDRMIANASRLSGGAR